MCKFVIIMTFNFTLPHLVTHLLEIKWCHDYVDSKSNENLARKWLYKNGKKCRYFFGFWWYSVDNKKVKEFIWPFWKFSLLSWLPNRKKIRKLTFSNSLKQQKIELQFQPNLFSAMVSKAKQRGRKSKTPEMFTDLIFDIKKSWKQGDLNQQRPHVVPGETVTIISTSNKQTVVNEPSNKITRSNCCLKGSKMGSRQNDLIEVVNSSILNHQATRKDGNVGAGPSIPRNIVSTEESAAFAATNRLNWAENGWTDRKGEVKLETIPELPPLELEDYYFRLFESWVLCDCRNFGMGYVRLEYFGFGFFCPATEIPTFLMIIPFSIQLRNDQ